MRNLWQDFKVRVATILQCNVRAWHSRTPQSAITGATPGWLTCRVMYDFEKATSKPMLLGLYISSRYRGGMSLGAIESAFSLQKSWTSCYIHVFYISTKRATFFVLLLSSVVPADYLRPFNKNTTSCLYVLANFFL